ncbi:hypothetical protein MNC86_23180 [Pantoea agglomerans]|uniref:hypothetical protein n=1 Tax=Enterobacter agglomerans TaxID=549 RepID=UPI001F4EFE76|nr:hypothetical protein [Pantoea agglomerans]MCH9408878.1 hypothetical protein [Pantoea agglomerans]
MGQKTKQIEPFFVSFIVLTASSFLMRAYENVYLDNNMCSWSLFFMALAMGIVTLANFIVFHASQPARRGNTDTNGRSD